MAANLQALLRLPALVSRRPHSFLPMVDSSLTLVTGGTGFVGSHLAAHLAEVPAMSVPIGRVNGLPVGGQVIAPKFGEADMFRVAYALESELGAEARR